MGSFGASQWKEFFESVEMCERIGSLALDRNNNLGDLNFVSELSGVTKDSAFFDGDNIDYLEITCSHVGSGNILGGLTGIRTLYVKSLNGYGDFSLLSTATSLITLSVAGSDLNSLNWVSSLENLTTLTISNSLNLFSLVGIENLNNLNKLTVNDTGVSSCVPLKDMTNLTYLDLRNNAIGQMSDDGGVPRSNLDILYQLNPNVTREDGKKGKLTSLYLQGNTGLKGIIDTHPILKLTWANGKIWE